MKGFETVSYIEFFKTNVIQRAIPLMLWPRKIGGSNTWPLEDSWIDSELPWDKIFAGVKLEMFSLEGNKLSISSIGGNRCSVSDVWLFSIGDAEDKPEFDVAGKFVYNNFNCFFLIF